MSREELFCLERGNVVKDRCGDLWIVLAVFDGWAWVQPKTYQYSQPISIRHWDLTLVDPGNSKLTIA